MTFDSAKIVLVLALAAGVFFRVGATLQKTTLTHDEGISYMAATGHEGEFYEVSVERGYPIGQWAPASDWKHFIEVDDRFPFRRISSDLARYDIHPPLYFWILHLLTLVFGVQLWLGPMINTVIDVFTAILIYRLGKRLLGSRIEAAVAMTVWVLSPFLLDSILEARPYQLLTLCTVLMVSLTTRWLSAKKDNGRKQITALAAVTAIGMLTHYQFPLVIVGCSGLLVVGLLREDMKRLVRAHLAMLLGIAVFVLINPTFYLSLIRQRGQAQAFSFEELPARFEKVVTTLPQFVMHARTGPIVLGVVFLGMVASLLWVMRGRRTSGSVNDAAPIVYFSAWTLGIITVLYLGFFSPQHAMNSKYLSIVLPFLAFVPVLLIRNARAGARTSLLVILCVWQLLYGAVTFGVSSVRHANPQQIRNAVLADVDRMVVDTAARGVIPRVVMYTPEHVMIYAAFQAQLLEEPERWITPLSNKSLLVSHLSYDNTIDSRAGIIQLLNDQFMAQKMPDRLWGPGFDTFRMTVRE